jgi:hypothetical protein
MFGLARAEQSACGLFHFGGGSELASLEKQLWSSGSAGLNEALFREKRNRG